MNPALVTSFITGTFCAVFAFGVEAVTEAVPLGIALGLAFCSGFLGSLFAQVILGRGR